MGMFDTVSHVPLVCPRCWHRWLGEVQTKDFDCLLDHYEFGRPGFAVDDWQAPRNQEEGRQNEKRARAAEKSMRQREGEEIESHGGSCPNCGLTWFDVLMRIEGGVIAKVVRIAGSMGGVAGHNRVYRLSEEEMVHVPPAEAGQE